jgi:hypothetical protein
MRIFKSKEQKKERIERLINLRQKYYNESRNQALKEIEIEQSWFDIRFEEDKKYNRQMIYLYACGVALIGVTLYGLLLVF